AVVHLQATSEASEAAPMGPTLLDRAASDLAGLEIRPGHRSTGNGDFMAAQTIQTILVEVIAGERRRASASTRGNSQPGPNPGRRQSTLGAHRESMGNF